ncbi:hypothetical protein [Hafnia alvei]
MTGFRDDAERLAHEHAGKFKKVVVETLKAIYSEKKGTGPLNTISCRR